MSISSSSSLETHSLSSSNAEDGVPDHPNPISHPINLIESRDKIRDWAARLTFKTQEAGKHFKKHGKEPGLGGNITTREEYVTAAQTNVVNSIFEKGFVMRSAKGDRTAFFTTSNTGFPKNMTCIGTFDGEAKLMTFFSANDKTPSLTARDFRSPATYIAYFEGGVSEGGWKTLTFGQWGGRFCTEGAPGQALDKPIDFLSL